MVRAALSLAAVALSPLVLIAAVDATVTREVLPQQPQGPFRSVPQHAASSTNFTEQLLKLQRGPSQEEIDEELKARKQRARERSERAREKLKQQQQAKPDPSKMQKMTPQQLRKLEGEHPWMRRAAWGSSSGDEWASFLEDPSQEYDKWSQAYRFLGGYIDCDHDMSEGSGSGDNDDNGDGQTACSRWMIWAAVRTCIVDCIKETCEEDTIVVTLRFQTDLT